MHYWNTKGLASKIKEGSINEKEKKNYYLATSIIGLACIYLAIGTGTSNGLMTFLECILLIIISVIGINITFKTNQGSEGSDYVGKVVVLTLPIMIKLLVLYFCVGILMGVVDIASGNTEIEMDMNPWCMLSMSAIGQLIFYWRLNVHLHYINS